MFSLSLTLSRSEEVSLDLPQKKGDPKILCHKKRINQAAHIYTEAKKKQFLCGGGMLMSPPSLSLSLLLTLL